MTVLSEEELQTLLMAGWDAKDDAQRPTATARAVEAAVIAKLDAKHLAMEEALAEQYAQRERHTIDVAMVAVAEIILEGKFTIKHEKNLSMFNGRPDYKPLQCVLWFNPEKQRNVLDRFSFEADFADERESEILFTVTRK